MKEASESQLRVALVCLFPDWGHVVPLVKIATAARAAGIEVRCYFPAKTKPLVDRAGLASKFANLPELGERRVFERVARRSLFLLNFDGYSEPNLLIYPKLIASVPGLIDGLKEDFEQFSPNIVVGDAHILSSSYEALAQHVGAIFVEHNASGTRAGQHRPFVRAYGKSKASNLAMSAVEAFGAVFERVYRFGFYALHFGRWLELRRAKVDLEKYLAAMLPRGHHAAQLKQSLTTGLAWIESEFLSELAPPNLENTNLPPMPGGRENIDSELVNWLEASDRPIVYISFGSILRLPELSYAKLAKNILRLNCRVLWSMPVGDFESIKLLVGDDHNFRLTNFVPQAELLRSGHVACFVSHAGSASVLEAMIGGVPVLCVPLHADNGYISSIVERLGIGLRVWKQEVQGPRFVGALKRLLEESEFRIRSTELAVLIDKANAPKLVATYLGKLRNQNAID